MGTVEVHILGQKYLIKGDAPPEHIQQLAEYVDAKLREVYQTSAHITPLKASILASLNIADELYRLKSEYNAIAHNLKNIEDKADSIIKLFE
ncbi:MAG: cell division protein ZapA [Alphaproteobacteria bacterium]|uniref:Cell division protein ZapA n=1 Tax=Candidatus Nitrobium versatile TaxID=2884831 RepID=A0A953J9R5_9BACT|nr:cell division protein ZapA [Candidatus Nitrobium versatile]